ncbi:MAG: hypothetical protein QXR85_02700 [Candidatus Micrarchaeaceae archaeon]
MEINIISDKPNKLLERREIECRVNYAERTPSRQEVKSELVHKLALKPELTVIVSIKQEYGLRSSIVIAHAYDNENAFGFVQKHLLERGMNVKKEKKENKEEQKEKESGGEAPNAAEAKQA